MAKVIINPLNESDIAFMKLWKEKVLPNKHSINISDVDAAASLIKFHRSGNCSSCNRNDVIELNNLYNRLLGQYEYYLAELQRIEDERIAAITKKKEEPDELIETFVQPIIVEPIQHIESPGKGKKTKTTGKMNPYF